MASTVEPIPEWKVKQAHAECMQDDVFAERFNNAPHGARTRLALECYRKVFASEVPDDVYAAYCAEVEPTLQFDDLKYLLRTEKDPMLLERWKELLLKSSPSAAAPAAGKLEPEPEVKEQSKPETPPEAKPEPPPDETKEAAPEGNKEAAAASALAAKDGDGEKKDFLNNFLWFIPAKYRFGAVAALIAAIVAAIALPVALRSSGSACAPSEGKEEAGDGEADSLDDLMDGKDIAAYDKDEHPASPAGETADEPAAQAAQVAETGDALFDELFSSDPAPSAPAATLKAAPAMPVAAAKKPASNALPTGIDAPAQPPPKPREVLESTLPPKPELTAEERAALEPIAKIDIVPLMARKRKIVAELEELQKNNPAVEFAATENDKNIIREESSDSLHYPKGLTIINRRFKCPFREGAYHNTENGNCEKGGYTDGNCTAFKHWYKWKLLLDKVERTKIYNQKIDEKDALVKEVAAKVSEILEARRKLGQ